MSPRQTTRPVLRASVLIAAAALLVGCTGGATSPAATEAAATTVAGAPPAVIPGQSGQPDVTVDPSAISTMFDPDERNDHDVEFMTMMLPHHQQAVELISYVEDRTDSASLLSIAGRMQDEQTGEIQLLESWLAKQSVPPLAGEELDAHMSSMAGFISPEQFAALAELRDEEFDKQFYLLMIGHHQGAVSMADAVLAEGINVDTRRLAADVKAVQNAEITAMSTLYAELDQ